MDGRLDAHAVWQAFYPNAKHVFMTRRNKVRLAVSWWRAIKSDEWHRFSNDLRMDYQGGLHTEPSPAMKVADLRAQYDCDTIEHLFVESNMREAAIQEEFEATGIVPFTVVYEDLIAAYEPTVRAVLDFLEIPERAGIEIPSPALEKIADDVSEQWTQRFRGERQARWNAPAW